MKNTKFEKKKKLPGALIRRLRFFVRVCENTDIMPDAFCNLVRRVSLPVFEKRKTLGTRMMPSVAFLFPTFNFQT